MDELSRLWPDARLFPLSAVACDDTQALVDHIARLLPPGPPFYPEDQLSTLPMRFMAAEIVREKLFLELEQELPYSLAVVTEHWQEDAELGTVLIHALIYVSRRNHKKMVIGRRGQRLKKVGSLARKELEAMLGTRVRLELWVKIRHGWDEDRNFLLQLQAETGE
jgi:GTP-binding protein Era